MIDFFVCSLCTCFFKQNTIERVQFNFKISCIYAMHAVRQKKIFLCDSGTWNYFGRHTNLTAVQLWITHGMTEYKNIELNLSNSLHNYPSPFDTFQGGSEAYMIYIYAYMKHISIYRDIHMRILNYAALQFLFLKLCIQFLAFKVHVSQSVT